MDTSPKKKLYRSRKHRVIAGVAGGIAEYFNIDAIIVRIIFIIFGFSSAGTAILLYILAVFLIPEAPITGTPTQKNTPAA